MPGPYDATTKYLVETYPRDWLSYLGIPTTGRVTVIDADLSTVTAEADKVLRIEEPEPIVVHLEFQSSYDRTMGRRLFRYNGMLHHDHEVPVLSVVVLLRPSADGPAMSGAYHVALSGRSPHITVEYLVRRVWQEQVSDLLAGPLGTLPIAPLGASEQSALPGLLRTVDRRFTEETTPTEADHLRVVTYNLLGLRFPPAIADQMMPGIRNMRDSLTYQAILEEGREEGREEGQVQGERRALLRVGTARLGPPDDNIRSRIEAINDLDSLDRLMDRMLTALNWTELLTHEPKEPSSE
jgi:predicted transposase YdaD